MRPITVTVGPNAAPGAQSDWVRFDDWAPGPVSIQCTVTGTVNYTVQQTLQDPNDPVNPVAPGSLAWVNHPDTHLVGATTTLQSNYAYAPVLARVVLNSGSGSVSTVFLQSSVVPE